jgi:hypothetical protein
MSTITDVSVIPFEFTVPNLDLGGHRAMGVSNLRYAPGGKLTVTRFAAARAAMSPIGWAPPPRSAAR